MTILIIRHLPANLSLDDKKKLLKQFGAESVWEKSKNHNYVYASFESEKQAKQTLIRLHQLCIGGKRLVVEYCENSKSTVYKEKKESSETQIIKEFLRTLNAWNPSLDLYHPPSPHLKYLYPDVNPDIAINIVHKLFTYRPFYIQVLHLMNKMGLETPFISNTTAINIFKDIFKKHLFDTVGPIFQSDSESELSNDELMDVEERPPVIVRRKHKLPIPSLKVTATVPPAPKIRRVPVNQSEVFDVTAVQEPKKISVIVSQDSLQKPTEETEVVGVIGTFGKETEIPVESREHTPEPVQPTITRKDLLKNRLSEQDMKILSIFKNYHPGQPSMRLYIKNLAKSVTCQDVESIYRLYVEHLTKEQSQGFDVRVLQKGRMKGQSFVTFPSKKIAETALTETNGYLLKERPMVVQFARAANKPTIE